MKGYTEDQQSLILSAIQRYFPNAEVLLFGSRKGEKFRKDSDLDLLIDTKEANDFSRKGQLRDQLENDTRLPYRVDLVFRDQVAPDFLSLILSDCERWIK